MQAWLFKGGLLNPKREFYTSSIRQRLMWIRHDPTQFCIINSFCLTRGQNNTALATEVSFHADTLQASFVCMWADNDVISCTQANRDHNSGAVIVRFRLKHRLEQILPPTRYPRDSKTFKRFVKNFLGEIASALRCPVGRYVPYGSLSRSTAPTSRAFLCSIRHLDCNSTCTPARSWSRSSLPSTMVRLVCPTQRVRIHL